MTNYCLIDLMTSLRQIGGQVMAKDKISVLSKASKKNTSLRLDNKTLKKLKIQAIEKETSVQKIIENLINNYLNEAN